ncbi:MAG: hypothetical protein Q9226_009227 [Calogaya cf. arnoldii]
MAVAAAFQGCHDALEELARLTNKPSYAHEHEVPQSNWDDQYGRFRMMMSKAGMYSVIDLQPDARIRDQPFLSWRMLDSLNDLEMEVNRIRHWLENGPQDQNETPLDSSDEEDVEQATLQDNHSRTVPTHTPTELQGKHLITGDIIRKLERMVASMPKTPRNGTAVQNSGRVPSS